MPDELSRRGFLKVASVLALTANVSAGPVRPAKIGFGFSLYGMRTLKVIPALRVCADIGYSGVELACLKDWPCAPEALRQPERTALRSELDGLGLELPALMENLNLLATDEQHRSNLERLKHACQLGHDLSPDEPPIVETVLGGKPDQWEAVREPMVANLREWEKVAAAHQTVIAIKAHAMEALHTPQDAKWLAEQVESPWIRLAFDYSHFQRQHLTLRDSLATMLPQTVFVHVKDNLTTDGKTEFILPGDAGDIDYAEYLKQLRDGGYRGAFVVEVSGQVSSKAGYDPIAAATRCYKNLRPAFVKAGLRAEA